MKLLDYDLKKINTEYVYRIEKNYYEVLNYDGNEEKLKNMVKELNLNSMFNITWSIYKNDTIVIIEEIVDTLD